MNKVEMIIAGVAIIGVAVAYGIHLMGKRWTYGNQMAIFSSIAQQGISFISCTFVENDVSLISMYNFQGLIANVWWGDYSVRTPNTAYCPKTNQVQPCH